MTAYSIDPTKGQMLTTLSNQWRSRPDDQRFLTLSALRDFVAKAAAESEAHAMVPEKISAIVNQNDAHTLRLIAGDKGELQTSHLSFGQLCGHAGAPAGYLRSLPAPLAAINLNYGLKAAHQDGSSLYIRDVGTPGAMLRAITSESYGRILDVDVVDAVMKVAGEGSDWKVPGMIQWGATHGIKYNPNVDVTKESTTLYASDRDVFVFLVDDLHPIEVGKLKDGSPDLVFRGFYVWNSEVGTRSFGIATMYLRGVCQNRCLWGVEGFSETTFAHTSGAPDKFAKVAQPALLAFSQGATDKLIAGVKTAKSVIVASDDDAAVDFLKARGFSVRMAKTIIETFEAEEGGKPVSVWDFAMGITAAARQQGNADKRLMIEKTAGAMLDKVAA